MKGEGIGAQRGGGGEAGFCFDAFVPLPYLLKLIHLPDPCCYLCHLCPFKSIRPIPLFGEMTDGAEAYGFAFIATYIVG
jgi:hypothetical protein